MEEKLEKQVEHIIITKSKFYWGLICAIIGACVAVGIPFFDIKQDVALIKSNHYTHIENLQNQVKDLKEKDTDLEKKNGELLRLIIDYSSKLDQLLGAHNIKINN